MTREDCLIFNTLLDRAVYYGQAAVDYVRAGNVTMANLYANEAATAYFTTHGRAK